MAKTPEERKEAWVAKVFGRQRSARGVQRALDRFEEGRNSAVRNLLKQTQVKLGIKIIRTYLDTENNKSIKAIIADLGVEHTEGVKALRRIKTLFTNGTHRFVWSSW